MLNVRRRGPRLMNRSGGLLNRRNGVTPPAPNPLVSLYGTGMGQIPIHLRVADAVMSAGKLASIPNAGGAGAYFNATAGGELLDVASGLIQFTTAFSWLQLANAADLDGVRLFVVAKRANVGNRRMASMEGGTPGDGNIGNDRMVVVYSSASKLPDGANGSAVRLATGNGTVANEAGPIRETTDLSVYEIQKIGAAVTVRINGEPEITNPTAADIGPFPIDRLFSSQVSHTANWNGPIGDVLSVITDGSHAAQFATARSALAAAYGITLA